ncbi:ribonucleoside-diphosphate reductase subunit alpha [Bordetella genomosp. 9]|uniref:Ribonucleoside-diphosphate reductase n=1 Tax=Bordetella genomosp. 9 TaxID=1416803 RepID=A0A261R7D9_9BORD|nr:ribonucleoside-diphosphate reductase subunit alpha [Bordetella genomosp. 9]OZI20562.1 ribonucleoside-diphosphate reductase subunit alpha [Bordetella genomosp. 9]
MQQTSIASVTRPSAVPPSDNTQPTPASGQWAGYQIIRRNGAVVGFEPSKIAIAMTKAFLAVNGGQGAASARVRELVDNLTRQAVNALLRNRPNGGTFHIEEIQDQVELALMRSGEHDVARAYVLYREKRSQERAAAEPAKPAAAAQTDHVMNVTDQGVKRPLDLATLRATIEAAGEGLSDYIDAETILKETVKNLYDGIPVDEVYKSAILSARALVEKDPAYSQVTARLLLHTIRKEVLGEEVSQAQMTQRYADYFPTFITRGIEASLIDTKLAQFDLPRLAAALDAKRDLQFSYLGLQTLYDRYFLHIRGRRIELPQVFYMRVAMGLALGEAQAGVDREARAIQFYEILSSFDFMSSTPTLFNSGTLHSQLSSCYLTTVSDDLEGIYDAIKENALLAKYAGGLGNDWTPVRALRSHIKGTNGESQGVVPFLKVVNDTAVAVNQGGKRKGAVCTYLETWHLDIEEFLELRKNTGDERRRTHDMNTANWIPDLFMKRVMENGEWTLFSPSDCPDLHDKYGREFEQAYLGYEARVASGDLKLYKKMPAINLWRKMLSMLFETGHPWITFKDPCNIRSPQQHVGVVHSSNLCTEITLNTNEEEIAVCNLGSVNLVAHMKPSANGGYELDLEKLKRTIGVAMRMLDNVIDINYYAVKKAKDSNQRHRPVGLGIMGFQDCLHMMRVPYASQAAVEFADRSMEAVCYYAYWASSELAEERGHYPTYKGSLWDRGILPQDTLNLLREERGGSVDVDMSAALDWDALRARIKAHGMRNSNCVAIAPTATISNIIGVSACIEPTYQNLYVKSNLSGEFTVVNEYLVRDLKKLGLWDEVMVADLKYFDGSLSRIDRVPAELREIYATAFEVEPRWLVECASRRQKWIDQSQSLNIYMAGASGKKLDETYKLAWLRGLKTTYYLRTLGATSAEKSTGRGGELNAVASGSQPGTVTASAAPVLPEPEIVGAVCTMRPGDPGFEECEACQ